MMKKSRSEEEKGDGVSERVCERGKSESRSRVIEKEREGGEEHREYYIAQTWLSIVCFYAAT